MGFRENLNLDDRKVSLLSGKKTSELTEVLTSARLKEKGFLRSMAKIVP